MDFAGEKKKHSESIQQFQMQQGNMTKMKEKPSP